MCNMSMLNKIKCILIAIVLLAISTYAKADCTSPVVSPSTITTNPQGGTAGINLTATLTMSCGARDPYILSTTQSSFTGSVNGVANRISAAFYTDSTYSTNLFGNSTSGANRNTAGTLTVTLYIKLRGPSAGDNFAGNGPYSFPVTFNVKSNTTTSTLTITLNGTVQGSCAFSNPTVTYDFGTVQSGTNPVKTVSVLAMCTQGVNYLLSETGNTKISIAGNVVGTAWLFAGSTTTQAIADTPVSGIGDGTYKFNPLTIRLDGPSRGTPIVGSGSFTGTFTLTLTY